MLLNRAIRTSLGRQVLNPNFVRCYSTGAGKCLVIADHDNNQLYPSSYNTITAASKLGSVDVLVAGNKCEGVAKKISTVEGVTRVLHTENEQLEHPLAEVHTNVILHLLKSNEYTHILAPASSFGKNLLPRIAGCMNSSAISDITKIVDANTFVRPIYAGNALATVKSNEKTKIITVRSTAFEKAKEGSNSAKIETVDTSSAIDKDPKSKWESSEVRQSTRPDLASSRVVVSGGRGMKNGENFKMLEELADTLGGAVGASRAAVDAGYVPNELQVGQTGKIVAPELYIAVGISGAIQHLAGMKDSKVIVAINKDAEAPFFQVADVGLVADLFTAVPELTAALKKEKK